MAQRRRSRLRKATKASMMAEMFQLGADLRSTGMTVASIGALARRGARWYDHPTGIDEKLVRTRRRTSLRRRSR